MGYYKFIAWAILTWSLVGCMSVEKAEKVMRAHPKELAKLCADCFPVKESEVLKGDTIVVIDEVVRVETDTVRVNADCPDGTVVTVDCPPNKTIYRDRHTHTSDTIKVRDTAHERVISDEVKEYKDKYANMELSRDKWRKWCLCGWGILVALGIGVFLKWYIRNRTILRLK